MTTKKTTNKKPAMKDIWETLSKINVNEYLQKKGDFDYLPWADAWAIMMEHYPEASFQNHYNENGYPCFYDPQGRGMVRVSVTICGLTHTEDYMITNWGNTVIKDPSPSEVNNCLKRALAKCMAYFGLASYLYNSEDMADPAPSEDDAADEPVEFKPATDEQITIIKAQIVFSDNDNLEEQLVRWAGLNKGDSIEDISYDMAEKLVEKYNEKTAK